MTKIATSISTSLLAITTCFGQTDQMDQFREKWPNASGVFLQNNSHVEISISRDGIPEIEEEHYEERLFLNETAKHYIESDVSYSSFFDLIDIEPVVYILEDGKYKKNKIKSFSDADDTRGNAFYDDVKKKKFYYSGLSKGGKTELTYTTLLKQPEFFGSFFFASYFPVENSTYEVKVPKGMKITHKVFGEAHEKSKIKYTVEEKGRHVTHRWHGQDLEPISIRDNTVPVKSYALHIQLYINSYEHKGETHNVIRDLSDLYSFYRGFIESINREPSKEIEAIADSLTQGLETREEKVKAIFYWIQDNIKYIAIEDGLGGFIPREAALVCSRRYGDCKDNSSLMVEMLNHIGIPAYYAWIGTTDIPYSYNEVPTPAADNHMVAAYHDGEKYVILDGTGKHLKLGWPTAFIQGKEALIGIDEGNYVLHTVPVRKREENMTLDSLWVDFEGDLIVGHGNVTYSGYSSLYLSEYLKSLNEDNQNRLIENLFSKGNNKSTVTPKEIIDLEDRDNELRVTYEFNIPDHAKQNGDELYYNPHLKRYMSQDKIDTSMVKVGLFKPFREIVKEVQYIHTPEGYSIDYVPQNDSFEHEGFGYDIQFKVNKEDQVIEVITMIDLGHRRVIPDQFDTWNKMIEQLNATYSELIIFKKES